VSATRSWTASTRPRLPDPEHNYETLVHDPRALRPDTLSPAANGYLCFRRTNSTARQAPRRQGSAEKAVQPLPGESRCRPGAPPAGVDGHRRAAWKDRAPVDGCRPFRPRLYFRQATQGVSPQRACRAVTSLSTLLISSREAPGRTATTRASTASSGTSCSTASCSGWLSLT
jgi:hypothetical protein